MTGRQPDEYYIALERRLRALEPQAKAVLAPDPTAGSRTISMPANSGWRSKLPWRSSPDDAQAPAARVLAAALLREAEAMGLAGGGGQ